MSDEAGQRPGLPIAGTPRERADAAANRVRILEAARRVLDARGAAGASVDAIAAEAGVGKGTVFRRFGDRAGLFEALLDEHMGELQQRFLQGPPPLGPGAPPVERLVAFFDAFLDFQDQHAQLGLALERGRWLSPIAGGYAALSLHVRNLLAEMSPTLDATTTAHLLLNAVDVTVVVQLREDLGELKAAVRTLILRLAEVRTG